MEIAGLISLSIATIAAILLVPVVAWSDLAAPTTLAVYGFLASLVGIGVARGLRSPRAEQAVLVVFLASMPLVYVAGAVLAGGDGVVPELAGAVVFGAIAFAARRRPAVIAAGIALHGVGWDSWHAAHGAAVPPWYALACMIIDLGVASYAISRRPRP